MRLFDQTPDDWYQGAISLVAKKELAADLTRIYADSSELSGLLRDRAASFSGSSNRVCLRLRSSVVCIGLTFVSLALLRDSPSLCW